MSVFKSLFSVFAAVSIALAAVGTGAQTVDARHHYEQGMQHYESENYATARAAFEQAVQLSPETAKYHHMLGRSYGQLAEQSNWLKAMHLARKTLRAFQRADELDQHDEQIITDLMQYYSQAPAFLGGSEKKASALQERLKKLRQAPVVKNITY